MWPVPLIAEKWVTSRYISLYFTLSNSVLSHLSTQLISSHIVLSHLAIFCLALICCAMRYKTLLPTPSLSSFSWPWHDVTRCSTRAIPYNCLITCSLFTEFASIPWYRRHRLKRKYLRGALYWFAELILKILITKRFSRESKHLFLSVPFPLLLLLLQSKTNQT